MTWVALVFLGILIGAPIGMLFAAILVSGREPARRDVIEEYDDTRLNRTKLAEVLAARRAMRREGVTE